MLTLFLLRLVRISYSLRALYTPLRAYRPRKRDRYYFLFDLYYYANALNLLFLWVFPSSAHLWIACYWLSHGSLANTVVTCRDSVVFCNPDKLTTLFIHHHPSFMFTAIWYVFPTGSLLCQSGTHRYHAKEEKGSPSHQDYTRRMPSWGKLG